MDETNKNSPDSTTCVRPAEQRDIPGIKFVAYSTGMFPPDILDDMIFGYLAKQNSDIWLVHEDSLSETLTGFAFCEPEQGADGAVWNLVALAVDPSHQKKGIAKKMLDDLEGNLIRQRGRLLLVETGSTDNYDQISVFLSNVGFKVEARIAEYYAPGVDKVIFWRKLPVNTVSSLRGSPTTTSADLKD